MSKVQSGATTAVPDAATGALKDVWQVSRIDASAIIGQRWGLQLIQQA